MRSRITSLRTGARVVPGATRGLRRRFATPRASKQSNGQPSPERLTQLAWGFAPPLILDAALNFRVFDRLDSSPKTVAELAAQSGASTRGLTAVLNALVGLGLLARRGDRYALTPESAAFLVSTKPAYLGGFHQHLTRQVLPNWMPGGTVAISEFVPHEDRTGPLTPLIFAVNMLVHTEAGDAFTFSEIAKWLGEAGFVNPRWLEAPAPSPLILATRP